MNKYDVFLKGIVEKTVVRVRVNSYDKGVIERDCIPFDYGPSRRYKDSSN